MRSSLLHVPLKPLVSYNKASQIQDVLVRRALDLKLKDAKARIRPTLLTMEMSPTYTTGRRDRGLMDSEERKRLEQKGAVVRESLRGGQTTFHGPGQLVVYPILDLSSSGLHVKPKCYVDTLEQILINTLQHFDLEGFRTEHTGVWIKPHQKGDGIVVERKIAAIGVHLRRNISSHGIALNISTDLSYFDEIVACGLADRKATSMRQEGSQATLIEVTSVFIKQFVKAFDIDEVELGQLDDVV